MEKLVDEGIESAKPYNLFSLSFHLKRQNNNLTH